MEQQERIVLKFTPEEGEEIVLYEDNPDFETVEITLLDHTDDRLEYEIVIKRLSDGLYFKSYYYSGENYTPYEFDDFAEFTQVFKVTKTIETFE